MGYVDYNTFLMFGDSITEFSFNQTPGPGPEIQFALGPALQNAYARKLQILHRGFSGYTSRDAVSLVKLILKSEFDQMPETKKIKLAYVFFGTNDARAKGKSSENNAHIPLDKYLSNMKEVVEEFKKRNIPLIVVTPGYHDQIMWDKTHPEDLITGDLRSNEINKMYQDIIKDNIKDTPVLCLYDEMTQWIETSNSQKAKSGDYSELLSDGIHFSGTGYKILYDGLIRLIKENFEHLSPEYMPYRFPHYTELGDETFVDIHH